MFRSAARSTAPITSNPLPVLVTLTLCGWLWVERFVGSNTTWVRWMPALVRPSQRTRLLRLSATSMAPVLPSRFKPRGPSTSAASAGPTSPLRPAVPTPASVLTV